MEDIKNSQLWAYAEEEFNKLSLNERIKRLADIIQPDKDNSKLSVEEKIKIIMTTDDPMPLIRQCCNPIEDSVVDHLSRGYTYNETAKECNIRNRSSIRKIIKQIRIKLIEELNG